MKIVLNSLLVLAVAICTLPGCKPDPPEVPKKDVVTNQLKSGIWKINTVTVDGVASTLFDGMTLAFTATGFTSTNATPVWPASGTWSFVNADDANELKRNDNVNVKIDAISETGLTLSLTWNKTTLGNGREQSVSGKHVFNLRK